MPRRSDCFLSLLPGLLFSCVFLATTAKAGPPFPPLSTCTVTITQSPTRTACISNFDPDVVRLTPGGSTALPLADAVSVTVRTRTPNNLPIPNAFVSFVEQTGTVNIPNGGSTTAITDATGLATVSLYAASGYGEVVLCADGVQLLCRLSVRSPDVNKGATLDLCGIGTSMTAVNGADITNPVCGFIANFGAVTPGVNDAWDLDCTGTISGADVTGTLGKGGVLQYFGDTGTLGSKNLCQ